MTPSLAPRPWTVAAVLAATLVLAVLPHLPGRGAAARPVPARVELAFLADPAGTLAADEAADPYWLVRYTPLPDPARQPPLGPVRAGWYRILLAPAAGPGASGAGPAEGGDASDGLVLEVRNRRLPRADLYTPTGLPGSFVQQRAGRAVAAGAGARAADGGRVAFPLDDRPDGTVALFLRVEDPAGTGPPLGEGLRLWDSRIAFERTQRLESAGLGLTFGVLLAVLVYLGAVTPGLGWRATAAYGIHLLLLGAFLAVHHQIPPAGEAGVLAGPLLLLSGAALGIHGAGLLGGSLPRLVAGAAILAAPFAHAYGQGPWPDLVRPAVAAILAALPLALAASAALAWRRARPAEAALFAPAFAAFLSALVATAADLRTPGLESRTVATLQWTALVQMLGSAGAIAWRLRTLARERERMQAGYAARLEQDVATRTADLARANAEKDRLFSIIGHDLRSPLDGITAVADQMARQPALFPPEELAATAADLREGAARVRDSLTNLLQWARLQSGRWGLAPAAVPVAALVDDVERLHRAVLRSRDLTLATTVPDGLEVLADREAALVMLRNLVSNALRHAPPGSTVRLEARRAGPAVTLAVADAGPGLDPARLRDLLAGDPAALSSGGGLGLLLVRDLARASAGRLEASSLPGHGATFTLHLPVA